MTREEGQGDLNGRLVRLEARQELTNLVARYCAAVDAKDLEAFLALFMDDAEYGELSGKQAMREYLTPWMAQAGPSFHYPHTHVVEFLSDTVATGTVTSHSEIALAGTLVLSAIRYEDKYVLASDQWKFAERRYKYLYRLRLEDLAAHYGEVWQM